MLKPLLLRKALLVALVAIVSLWVFAPLAGAAPGKTEILARFKDLQARHGRRLKELDEAAKKRFQEATTISLKTANLNLADKAIEAIAMQLGSIDERREELGTRRDLVDRLIFQIDTKWGGQALQPFLEHLLLDMAVNDLNDVAGDGRLWKFMTYLSIAIREVPEPREDLVSVIESYMNWSTVLNPKTPAEFLQNRDYSNGAQTTAAKVTTLEAAGDDVEKRIPGKKKADIELKVKVLPPAPPMSAPKSAPKSADEEIEQVTVATPTPAPPATPTPEPSPTPSPTSTPAHVVAPDPKSDS